MRTSIIVPCHNEERTIGTVLDNLNALSIDKQIIVVDDGSTDGTAEILQKHHNNIDILVTLPNNRGKGAAVREGINHVEGDIVIVQDADLEYDVNCIPTVIAPIVKDDADVVYGSRFLVSGSKGHPINYLANKFFSHMYAKKTGWNMTDVYACQKAARTSLVKQLDLCENAFGFDVEITVSLSHLSNRYTEVPVSYNPRTKKEGKHIGLKDGFRGLYLLSKYRKAV